MVVGCSYFPPFGLGWPAFAAICLPVIGGVPGRPGPECSQGHYLNDVLQMLDEHYGIVMTFNTLSKELYSLKQGSGENVAEFGVCLSQQVQTLQSEFMGRVQQEYVEEMKQDCFYKGLNPHTNKCWPMKLMVNTALDTLTCSKQSGIWKDRQKPEIL